MIEPPANVVIGVWILSQEIKRYGLNWKAVASYHTPLSKNPERGRIYAEYVYHHLLKVQGIE
ncbi:lytic transglycosylase catalytic domain protein [Desulfovibrio sp. A2]|nr:lytic transglycosylase catalytic domain protein [Desulfovibrio sp. A2]